MDALAISRPRRASGEFLPRGVIGRRSRSSSSRGSRPLYSGARWQNRMSKAAENMNPGGAWTRRAPSSNRSSTSTPPWTHLPWRASAGTVASFRRRRPWLRRQRMCSSSGSRPTSCIGRAAPSGILRCASATAGPPPPPATKTRSGPRRSRRNVRGVGDESRMMKRCGGCKIPRPARLGPRSFTSQGATTRAPRWSPRCRGNPCSRPCRDILCSPQCRDSRCSLQCRGTRCSPLSLQRRRSLRPSPRRQLRRSDLQARPTRVALARPPSRPHATLSPIGASTASRSTPRS
mmetsp:Transcript_41026/g.112914  ORF Transcript_41026/g.112914 Transcript_41026/m.112914 type:complete len:290 (-) Transcript_41026:561-1430(-)